MKVYCSTTVADVTDMYVLVCFESISYQVQGDHITMACLSGKGRGKNVFFLKTFFNTDGPIFLPPSVPHFLAKAGTTKMRTSSFGLMLEPAKILGHRVPTAKQSSSKASSCKCEGLVIVEDTQ